MAVKKEKRMNSIGLRCLWMLVGFILVGGIYFLSYNNVDEAVVGQTTKIVDYIRTVLK